ncbi:MAG: SDR family oxidoreductase [Chloroflexota bacterium]
MTTYLVTGAAGFIGSNIVEELVARGAEVRAFDNLSTGKISNLQPFMDKIAFIEGDLNDGDLLRDVVRGADYILHQGALPSVPRSMLDPLKSHEANATGTLKLLIAARDEGVKRLVYASSSSVYGNSPTLPKREDMPTQPLSPYAVNKLAAEQYCRVFAREFGLPAVALRYFNVFGPRQDPSSQYAAVIPAFISSVLKGQSPTIYGDGTQTRDFTYVQNVVQANLLACESDKADGEAINIACGERTSLLDLMGEINRLLGTDVRPIFQPGRAGDVKDSLADISKARELIGYTPGASFSEGLASTVRSMQLAAGR